MCRNTTAHYGWRFAGSAAGTGPAAPGFRLVLAMHCRSRCIRLLPILAHSLGPTSAFSWQCDMCGAKKCSPGGSRTPAARLHPSHAHKYFLNFGLRSGPTPGSFLVPPVATNGPSLGTILRSQNWDRVSVPFNKTKRNGHAWSLFWARNLVLKMGPKYGP